jgi:uncharacterized protein
MRRHSRETRLKISESMKKKWSDLRDRAGQSNSSLAQNNMKLMSALVSRAGLASKLGMQFDGDRDLYKVLGYKRSLTFDHYLTKYKRQNVAARIVDAPAQTTWRRSPVVWDTNPKDQTSEFELAWKRLKQKLRVMHYLERADRLSGIGRYGVLLLGVRGSGGRNLETPLRSDFKDISDLAYLSVYTEGSAEIESFVGDRSDPQFAKPEFYNIDLSGGDVSEVGMSQKAKVHHSRIIHIAEGVMEDEVLGQPRLQSVYNLFDDLEKVSGGAPEMFWQGAYRGLHIDINPEFQQGDLGEDELDALNDEVDEFVHGLRRIIRTQGVDVKPIRVQLADPGNTYSMIMDLISGASKIPKRILFGSERGELASQQDEINWNARITERQNQFAEPIILRPFIDKLVTIGILPRPQNDWYEVIWPSLFELDELRRSQAVWTWARAAEKLADAVAARILTPEQAFEILDASGVLGLTEFAGVSSLKKPSDETDVDIPVDLEQNA